MPINFNGNSISRLSFNGVPIALDEINPNEIFVVILNQDERPFTHTNAGGPTANAVREWLTTYQRAKGAIPALGMWGGEPIDGIYEQSGQTTLRARKIVDGTTFNLPAALPVEDTVIAGVLPVGGGVTSPDAYYLDMYWHYITFKRD